MFVHQEFPFAQWFMIKPVAHLVHRDIHPYDVDLTVFNPGIGLLYAHLFLADRLDLCPLQNNTGFERVENLVLKTRLFIPGNIYNLI